MRERKLVERFPGPMNKESWAGSKALKQESNMEIQISGQYGESRASDVFWPMQKKLNECFENNIKGGYLKSILKFAIGLRVSGKLCDFQSQGAERLRYLKKN